MFVCEYQWGKVVGSTLVERGSGADPAAEKGGPKLLTNDGGSRGLAPWRGLQGGRAPLRREILNF